MRAMCNVFIELSRNPTRLRSPVDRCFLLLECSRRKNDKVLRNTEKNYLKQGTKPVSVSIIAVFHVHETTEKK